LRELVTARTRGVRKAVFHPTHYRMCVLDSKRRLCNGAVRWQARPEGMLDFAAGCLVRRRVAPCSMSGPQVGFERLTPIHEAAQASLDGSRSAWPSS
jgi:hypothetical protein